MITRRAFLISAGAAMASLSYWELVAQDVKLRLVREIPKAQSAQVAPDGKKLIFLDWGAKETGTYCVVEIETGVILFRDSFKYHRACNFAGSGHLLMREVAPTVGKDLKEKLSIIDFYTKKRTEIILSQEDACFSAPLVCVSDRLFLAIHSDRSTHKRSFLSLVEFPDFREIAKVPYAVQPRTPMTKIGGMSLSNDFDLKISPNRKLFAYSYDHTLICRNVDALKMLWSQNIDPPLRAHLLAISADGRSIAAFTTNSQWMPDQSESIIFVYGGQTGAMEARMSIRGVNGSAISPSGNGFDISPDGKKFAVVDIAEKNNTWIVRIHIHEVPTGKRLTTLLHDKIGNAKRAKLPAFTTIHFTSDGRFLITSGINTKIWSIEQILR